MSDGIWAAASGAIGQSLALDVAAENVANASTPGYHVDRAVFREVLTKAAAKRGGGFNLVYGAVGAIATDPTPGAFANTGRPLDVAIQGSSYLAVKTERGERYTRYGSLQVTSDGALVTRNGDPLIGTDRRPIRVTPGTNVAIGKDGQVIVDGRPSGELRLVSFANPGALVKEGALLLRADQSAGAPTPTPASLEVGALETSGVSAVKGMVDIVSATRTFEVCQRAIDVFRDADRRAATDLMSPK